MNEELTLTHIKESKSGVWFTVWSILFIFCLVIFTLARLPKEKINSAFLSLANEQLKSADLNLSASEGSLSFSPGLIYSLQGVRLEKIYGEESFRLSEVEFDPHWIFSALGRPGIDLFWEEGTGLMESSIEMRSAEVKVKVGIEGISLGSTGLFQFLTGLSGNGDLTLHGDWTIPRNGVGTISGQFESSLKSLNVDLKNRKSSPNGSLDPLALIASKFPSIRLGEIQAKVKIENGTIELEDVRFLKGSVRDSLLEGTVKGKITPGRVAEDISFQLSLDLKASESLNSILESDPLLKSLVSPYEKNGRFKLKTVRDPRQMPRFEAL